MAASFAETRWDKVVESYELLDQVSPSPLHRLGLALATAEWKGVRAGLAIVEESTPPTWLEGSYQWSVVLADLHKRCGNTEKARTHATRALELAPTEAVRELLARRLGM